MVENLSKTIDGVKILDNISFTLGRRQSCIGGGNEQAKPFLFKILMVRWKPIPVITNGCDNFPGIFRRTIQKILTMI